MGCNHIAEAQCPESHWIDLVREAVDLGVTIFDTAEAYQQGGSEDILGKALGNADGIYIASKVGESSGAVFVVSSDRTRACEASLKRLRRDCVDVYQLHSPPAVKKWNGVTGALRCSDCGKPGRSACAPLPSAAQRTTRITNKGTRALSRRCRSRITCSTPRPKSVSFP